ncbi:hypothetical protein BGZ59_011728 [Podila verticillata]|nr:hypothetical protein BGZ59_011728 [Podila verticillata]
MPNFSQSMSGPPSGTLAQSPGSVGTSDSYFRPLVSPGISGDDSSYHPGANSGIFNNQGTSGSNQRPHHGVESPLESLAALSVMSPTLPIPPTTSRSNSGYSGYTSSSSLLQTPTSSSPLTTTPSSLPTLSSLYHQGSNFPMGLTNNDGSNEGNRGSFAFSQHNLSSDIFSAAGSFQGTSRSNQQQQLTSGSSIQASLPNHSSFNQYSLSSQYGQPYQQQPTPGQSPQSKQLHGSFSKSHDSSTTNNDSVANQNSNDDPRTTSALSDPMSASEATRDRSRSRSAAGPLVIPTRNIPPRAPQTTAPRKYHGRQSRKPLLDHPTPHHHLQQYQGFVPHYHPSSSYQHPAREPVPPTRRIAHILSEQKRREKINGGFDELKSVIPECAQNTDSKATILRKAVDYILLLEDELRKYTDQYQLQGNGHDPDYGDHDDHN